MSEPHRHANCHESLHLLEGQICEYIDGEAFDMVAGETVFIPQNAVHYTQNTSEEVAVMMISYSQGTRDYTKA